MQVTNQLENMKPSHLQFRRLHPPACLAALALLLTNKAWRANPSAPLAEPDLTTDSGGNALVAEGHTVLKGKVIIEQAKGDVAIGIYGDN